MSSTPPLVGLIDGGPEMWRALRRLLNVRGFKVEEYERGEDLLASVGLHPPDCLLLDLQMSG